MPASRIDKEIYLDNNASTAPLPEVVAGMTALYKGGALNPSSFHRTGDRARQKLETARKQLARLIGAAPPQIVFTSGATEANHLLLRNLLSGPLKGFRFVTTEVEHSSIIQTAHDLERLGLDVHIVGVDEAGRLDTAALIGLVRPGRTLISVQWANNETGVIQPLLETASLLSSGGALIHTDATQAIGKIPVDLSTVPADFLSLSAHKFHGPLGAGALFVRDRSVVRASLRGGEQEGGLRPGTENVPAIVGMGIAAALRQERLTDVASKIAGLRDRFEQRLMARGIVDTINGCESQRLPNTSNIRFSAIDGEALVIRLDAAGVHCSQSSACTAHKPEPSYVLRAMGLSEEQAYRSVRFSLSEQTSEEEVDMATEIIADLHSKLTKFHALSL